MSAKADVNDAASTLNEPQRPRRSNSNRFVSNWAYRRSVNGGVNCPECKERFVGNSALSKHFKRDHKGSGLAFFSCDECDRVYRRYECLQSHKRITHNSGRPVKSGIKPGDVGGKDVQQCKICKLPFKGAYRLSNHVYTAHKDSTIHHFNCDRCDKSFRHANTLRWHKKRHERGSSGGYDFHCELCDMRTATYKGLTRHQVVVHKGVTEVARAQHPTGEGSLKCPGCNETFKTKRALSAHLVAKHPEIRHFECTKCLEKFQSYGNMLYHRSAMPNCKEDRTPKLACQVCTRKFSTQQGVVNHCNRLHGGMTPATEKKRSCRRSTMKQKKGTLADALNNLSDNEDYGGLDVRSNGVRRSMRSQKKVDYKEVKEEVEDDLYGNDENRVMHKDLGDIDKEIKQESDVNEQDALLWQQYSRALVEDLKKCRMICVFCNTVHVNFSALKDHCKEAHEGMTEPSAMSPLVLITNDEQAKMVRTRCAEEKRIKAMEEELRLRAAQALANSLVYAQHGENEEDEEEEYFSEEE